MSKCGSSPSFDGKAKLCFRAFDRFAISFRALLTSRIKRISQYVSVRKILGPSCVIA